MQSSFTVAILSVTALMSGTAFAQGDTTVEQPLDQYQTDTQRVKFQNVYRWDGPSLETNSMKLQASGMTAWEIQGGGEDATFVNFEANYVDMNGSTLSKGEQIQVGLCVPDAASNAIQCTVFTFESDGQDQSETQYMAWGDYSSMDYPPMDPNEKVKDNLMRYYSQNEDSLYMLADQQIMNNFGDIQIRKNGLNGFQTYNFVAADTGIIDQDKLQATIYFKMSVAENQEFITQAKAGELVWMGKQFISCENSEGQVEFREAEVRVAIAGEGADAEDDWGKDDDWKAEDWSKDGDKNDDGMNWNTELIDAFTNFFESDGAFATTVGTVAVAVAATLAI